MHIAHTAALTNVSLCHWSSSLPPAMWRSMFLGKKQAEEAFRAKCLAGEGEVVVCAATTGLHTLNLKAGKAGQWSSYQLSAVQKDSLRLSGDVAEVRLEGGEVVKKLEVSSGSLSQVITGQGAVLEAGCGVTVSQPCQTEGRDGQGYCDTRSLPPSASSPPRTRSPTAWRRGGAGSWRPGPSVKTPMWCKWSSS